MADHNARTFEAQDSPRQPIDWSLAFKINRAKALAMVASETDNNEGASASASTQHRLPESDTWRPTDQPLWYESPRATWPEPEPEPEPEPDQTFYSMYAWRPQPQPSAITLPAATQTSPSPSLQALCPAPADPLDRQRLPASTESRSIHKCPVCFGPVQEPVATRCGHVFCNDCIDCALCVSRKCPVCQRRLSPKHCFRIYI